MGFPRDEKHPGNTRLSFFVLGSGEDSCSTLSLVVADAEYVPERKVTVSKFTSDVCRGTGIDTFVVSGVPTGR